MTNRPLDNEARLLAEIAEGNKRAFEEVFCYYQRFVFIVAKKVLRSDELAKEIVQDVFLKIWLGREKVSRIENFGGYLNTLVRNHCYDALRQAMREGQAFDTLRLNASERDESTQQQIDYRQSEGVLKEAIASLSPQVRRAYTLCHIEGLKYDEAAAQMGISPQTLHGYMKEALAKIREHFKHYAIEYTVFISCLFK